MVARTRRMSLPTPEATRQLRVHRGAGAKKALQIVRNEALRLSPLELRNALALNQAHTVSIDYNDDADLTEMKDDAAAFDEMDGEENTVEYSEGSEQIGYLSSGGALEVRDYAGPFLDPALVYAISVVPERKGNHAFCHFEPPAWFGRVRGQGGQASVQRLTCVLSAVADLLSEEFAAFLEDPTPARFSWCEWKHLDENSASFDRSAILRKGLVERLNDRIGRTERLDEPSFGALLPRIWLLWPDPLLATGHVSAMLEPLVLPLSVIYERSFQIEVAARLSRWSDKNWPTTLLESPKEWDRAWRQGRMTHPVKVLDSIERVHLLSKLLHVAADELFLKATSLIPFQSKS